MKKTTFYLVSFFCFSLLSSCESDDGIIIDQKSAQSAKDLYGKLEESYKSTNSTQNLDLFFSNWNRTVEPNPETEIKKSEVVENIFEIYKEFYRPLNLSDLGEGEWGQNLNSGSKYMVVQNCIYYTINSDFDNDKLNWENRKVDSIMNFKPPVNLDKNIVLYLTQEYKQALNSFLGGKFTELGSAGIMNPSQPTGESAERYKILRSYIPVLSGHWGVYWHLETHPEASRVVINKEFTKARVYFRMGYMGGDATLEKTGNNWKLKESKLTWIE